ncbi:MAG: hypothetical protein H7A32_06135 [Deltaproteobacteria bacterium]|nr:hypothetical protein [Deltaproteobacteria bacterium]
MTPIADALAESLHIERQHAGKESTYWKGRSDGAAVGVMVDGTIMASGGGMMLGSGACEVGTGGVCTVVAAPAFATGAVLAGGGTASMVSHTGMYAEAQQQYLQSRARENASSSKKNSEASEPRKVNPSKAESPVWKELKPFREDIKTNGLSGKKQEFYKWDYDHNEIEVFDRSGNHKGAIDPTNREFIKDKVNGRKIDL